MTRLWIFCAALWCVGHCLECLDPNGKTVDWYIIYKAPSFPKSDNWIFKHGLAYYYLDVNNQNLMLSATAINDSSSPITNTLMQIYNSKDTSPILYMLYNDQPPKTPANSVTGGHTKGVIGFDKSKSSGFWLVHSTPKFPPQKASGYHWNIGASINGQAFLCVTFPYKELGNIAGQLWYNQVHIYDKKVTADYLEDFPILNRLINKTSPPGKPWFNVTNLASQKGQVFRSFAKSGKFGADLYDSLVAPDLKQDLFVETWLRAKGDELNSSCTAPYKVYRVKNITLPGGVEFSEDKDHSKWAVTSGNAFRLTYRSEKVLTEQTSNDWTCIGDINRMASQFKRGGGTMCLQNPNVWSAFRKSVAVYEKCQS
ncbi:unnamed protein product [Lymnaea stagnalis]|uniref:Uncharacterized protein n=1 Tax=Lymnaea stagnalis TaxID=6523 RepID=A0AAV2HR11_LYMST